MSAFGQSSMRRCSLLPITDSVGGAIGFKVFEEIESYLKRSNWCTYVSNSSMINVFSKYRENLPQYLKTKEVLMTVSDKLKVGSLVRVTIINEIRGVELQLEVHGENGEDIYFSEKVLLKTNEVEAISDQAQAWLEIYSKTIPYDAKVNGILGEQLTLDVGKGYPIQVGQKFFVKRLVSKKKHPLLKKIVDWDAEILAEGSVFSISDNQALGMVKAYSTDKKLTSGDWVRLEPYKEVAFKETDKKEEESPGNLGVVSAAFIFSNSNIDEKVNGNSNRWSGNLLGINLKGEAWITRQYFAAIELVRLTGDLKKDSGVTGKSKASGDKSTFKLLGGYKYLPVGFFYGPQVDFYGGYARFAAHEDSSFSGLMLGGGINLPLSRMYKIFGKAEFMPFSTFTEGSVDHGSVKASSVLDLEVGLKYQYATRMTLDASLETRSYRARTGAGDLVQRDNFFKLGSSFNF